ncbi:nuclease [Comamonas thiooxydans]|nr:nuclease [Comamonas thiooxydans]
MAYACYQLSFALALTLNLLASSLVHSETLAGTVVGLADGDTVTVLDASRTQYRIRLAGIDAPEKKQDFGGRSRQSLSELVFQKPVRIEYTKTDRYGRIVGKVMVNNIDASLEQLKRGMAWHYKAYEREQSLVDRALYAQSETDAQRAGRGLWQDPSPIPPWEFRKMR